VQWGVFFLLFEAGKKGGAPKGNKNNRFCESTTKVQAKYNQSTSKVQAKYKQ
jgi:hypothetical protein